MEISVPSESSPRDAVHDENSSRVQTTAKENVDTDDNTDDASSLRIDLTDLGSE